METIEWFSEFLQKLSVPNFLVIGIVIIIVWLILSGFKKGLKSGCRENKNEEE